MAACVLGNGGVGGDVAVTPSPPAPPPPCDSDDPGCVTYYNTQYGLEGGFYRDCNTTQAEAIAMFTAYLQLYDPCEWTKLNGPFICERSGPLGIGQRFSLAYANALLAYTVLSAAIVNIFFAAAKRKAEGRDGSALLAAKLKAEGKDVEADHEVEHVDISPTP